MRGNKRFYIKTEFDHNEAIELFIGQNAGNQLEKDILNAKEEVLVISPYISESKLDQLIRLKNRNIHVRIAFSDLGEKPEDYIKHNQILRKLLHQNKSTNYVKK